jgi:hypothetical protein
MILKKMLQFVCGMVLAVPAVTRAEVPMSPVVEVAAAGVLAKLENEHVQVFYVEAKRGGRASARPVVRVRRNDEWVEAPLDASAESYQVVTAPGNVTFGMPNRGYYALWTQEGRKGPLARVAWQAGKTAEAVVKSVRQLDARSLKLEFHPLPTGELEATWSLAPGEKSIKVALEFRPRQDGQYSLGYFLFNRKAPAEVDELLLPQMIQARRFPSKLYTYLQAQAPTPMSLMQVGPVTWTVAGDPDSTPFEFPVPAKSRYGLQIRDEAGKVHPSIFGPLVGRPDSRANKGGRVHFTFRVLVQTGDWYAAYRTVADEVFGWHDYRKNGEVSLTGAALNMIDLYMDDTHGGWWERAKASYQIESKNGSTQSTPLSVLSLYRLTGDREIYRKRVLPTLEFLLSRSGPHFSPIPEDTGHYAAGSMKGPVRIFGSTVYGGLWEMTNQRTPAFREAAFPGDKVRLTSTQQNFETHNQPFDEWLGRYLFAGDQAALERAVKEADDYIAQAITRRPGRELGERPFFLMAYTPAWEGLLRLYEVTGEQRFLDAAVHGARVVMTGVWTQPSVKEGAVVIHPDGYCHGDKMDLLLARGGEKFRLGWPRKPGDTPEKEVPAWLVSNAGLSFEQPATYTHRDNGGRMIFQVPWASAFLRLAHYTGDRQFETYARNAVVGRFANYPGYYYTTFTDLMSKPRFPYEGPDMSFIYYHHIPVHLSWTLDYLVSEAKLLSKGMIDFPPLRQFGYAYFDNLVYGHQPGEVMGEKDMWLWLDRELLELDNPQINHLTAQNGTSLAVILMNANRTAEQVTLTLNPEAIDPAVGGFSKARYLAGGTGDLKLVKNTVELELPARGLVVMAVDGLNIKVAAQQQHPEPKSPLHAGQVNIPVDKSMEVRAAVIQVDPGPWDAYVWSTAGSGSLREISLSWKAGGKKGMLTDQDYPYEFSVPVAAGETEFRFATRGVRSDGSTFETGESVIGVSP